MEVQVSKTQALLTQLTLYQLRKLPLVQSALLLACISHFLGSKYMGAA